jgi:hypothetical protein
MIQEELGKVNWRAALVGFGVDFAFSVLVGAVVISALLALKGQPLDNEQPMPSDVSLVYQIIGVVGAAVGGVVAGYLAGQYGPLHGVVASLIGLVLFVCSLLFLSDPAFSVGDLGFIVLNLIAAGYGGGLGERLRARRESDSDGET